MQKSVGAAVVDKMVKEINKNGKRCFVCSICEMIFKKRRQEIHCEIRCKEGKVCSGKMIRHSVQF